MAEPDLAALAHKAAALRRLRAAVPGSARADDAWADVDLTDTSNAIEGGTLSRQQTALVIETGITVGGKPLRDHLEAVDHHRAVDFVRALAARDEPLGEADLRAIHQMVLGRSDPDGAGRNSPHARFIQGSAVRFPPPAEIAPLMAEFAAWLAASQPSPETAFEGHYRLVTIHPFSDGYGRVARLLMNLLLLRAGYPPLPVGPEDREVYLTALEGRQRGGDPGLYTRLMLALLDCTLDQHLAALDPAAPDPSQAP